jgi:hypothetical protein
MAPRLPVLVIGSLLFGTAAAETARADPITVTSGTANITWDDPASFFLQGDGFRLSSLFVRIPVFPPPLEICGFAGGCAPGESFNLSSVVSDGQSQIAVVNGVTYAIQSQPDTWVDLSGRLDFEAGNVTVPPLPGGEFEPPISLVAPFTVDGRLAGFRSGSSVPLFEVDLVGRGTADLRLRAEGSAWRFSDLFYRFEDPAAVPEPMSLVLVGSGLAAMLGSRRKRGLWPRRSPPHSCRSAIIGSTALARRAGT